MKKYFFMAMATLVVSAAAVVGVKSYNYYSMPELMRANLEALSQGGDVALDTKYTRIDQKCRIHIGVKGKIQLLGGTILNANGDGYVEFDGHVICGSGGTLTCAPVECKDLYEVIRK